MSTSDLPPASVPPAAAPAKKSNTLVIVLCVILGIFVLLLGSCVATCVYAGKKAKAYAKESEKNPEIAALAIAAAIYPGVEVVSKDLEAGTIVLKNSKTGEILNLSAKDFSSDRIGQVLEKIGKGKDAPLKSDSSSPTSESSSSSASVSSPAVTSSAQAAAQESTLKQFQSDFPIYSSGSVKTIEASKNSIAGVSTAQHLFSTSDTPAKVAEFYEKKLADAGYSVLASENGSDDAGVKLSRVFQKAGTATVNVEVHIEDGKTHVEVNQVVLKQQ